MSLRLTDEDKRWLDGQHGEPGSFAMSVIVEMAEVVAASELVTIDQAHIDACALMSPSNIEFVERLADGGGRVRIPTTTNMIPLDLENWRRLNVPASFAGPASRIAAAYLRLGCIPTWTCAPYQGYLTPRFGQQLAWGESNAVVYANAVLGARTNRHGDYMDVCAALTGRVPLAGLHVTANRRGHVLIRIRGFPDRIWAESAAWAALGHAIGRRVGDSIPVIEGLPRNVSSDALKSFGAAAASSGAVAMFHAVGITPEAADVPTAFQGHEPAEIWEFLPDDLEAAWQELSTGEPSGPVDCIVLGCPHASYDELRNLTELIRRAPSRHLHPRVQFLVVTSTTSYALAARAALIRPIEAFGATLVLDTCPFHSPIVKSATGVLMTNSGKCAYYAPGELNADSVFGTMADCVASAISGTICRKEKPWDQFCADALL